MWTIAERTLVTKGSRRNQLATMHLEEVRDYLTKLVAKQDPMDHERTLNQLHVAFHEGQLTGEFLTPAGRSGEVMLFSDTGADQVAGEVLPARFFAGLRQLASMDAGGEKLATMAWAKFAAQEKTDIRRIRTVNMQVGGKTRRVIRSCHSQSYAPYSNLEFVEDLLNNAGALRELPVLDWRVTDGAMRLRFAGEPVEHLEINKPMPMIEGWNSEVGLRRIGLRGGMFKLVCTNGMGHWADRTEHSWIHRGDPERIRNGVAQAYTNLQTAASGVLDAYQDALSIQIDNAFLWMEAELNNQRVPERVITSAQKALHDPTTTPGGLLASVIDAVTLVAQDEIDLLEQHKLEKIASNMMIKGRSLGLNNNRRIFVEA